MPATSMPEAQADPRSTIVALLHRMACPVLIFCAVLLGFLVSSSALLLPMVTSVEMGGQRRSAAELREYAAALHEQIRAQEHARDALVLPMHDTPYRRMLDAKLAEPSTLMLLVALQEQARSLADAPDAVHITRAHYDAQTRVLHIRGDVRNVGPRSMTVLAQFVEMLRDMPRVRSVTMPTFVREEDPVIGFHSPFAFSVHLQ